MGMIRVLRKIFWLSLVSAGASQCIAANPVTLEVSPWPAERKCDACVTIQFVTMEMRLPLKMIGKVLVTGDSSLHILPPSRAPNESVLFLAIPPEKLLKLHKQSGLLQGLNAETNEQLFDVMGRQPGKNTSLTTLRKIEGIDMASRYTKASKDSVHVYWIQSPLPGGSQNVYFVIDNEEVIYMLSGDITQAFYEAVLSNLRIVRIP